MFGTLVPGRGDRLWAIWSQYLTLFGATIADAVGAPSRPSAAPSAAAVRATEFYVRLRQYSPPGSERYDEHDAAAAFAHRNIAIAILPLGLAFTGRDPSRPSPVGGVAYGPLYSAAAAEATVVLGETFLLSARAAHPREAVAVMQWAISDEAQVQQLINGGLAVRASSFNDRRVKGLPLEHQSVPFSQIWAIERLLREAQRVPDAAGSSVGTAYDRLWSALPQVLSGRTAAKDGLIQLSRRLRSTEQP